MATDLDMVKAYMATNCDRPIILFVDPLDTYIHKELKRNDDADVRYVLDLLGAFAEETGVAVLGVNHLRKDDASHPLYAVSGSNAYTSVPRSVWLADDDPEGPEEGDQKILACGKLNLAKPAFALPFEIADPGELVWRAARPGMASDIWRTSRTGREGPRGEAQEIAKQWLRKKLANGAQIASTDLERMAAEDGIKKRTLDRARQSLRIKARHMGKAGPEGQWMCSMPPTMPTSP